MIICPFCQPDSTGQHGITCRGYSVRTIAPHPTPEERARYYLDEEGRFLYGETTELAVSSLAAVIASALYAERQTERRATFKRALEILRETYDDKWAVEHVSIASSMTGYKAIEAEMNNET